MIKNSVLQAILFVINPQNLNSDIIFLRRIFVAVINWPMKCRVNNEIYLEGRKKRPFSIWILYNSSTKTLKKTPKIELENKKWIRKDEIITIELHSYKQSNDKKRIFEHFNFKQCYSDISI